MDTIKKRFDTLPARAQKAVWFVGLYVASILAIGAVAYSLRALILPA